MNVNKLTLLILSALVLALPTVQAGTVTFTVSDNLGPVITTDPLGLNGSPFSLTGTVMQGALGQTLYTPSTLSVTATALGSTQTLVACDTSGAPTCPAGATAPTLTLTTDSATLAFDVSVLGQLAVLTAKINLPGTFQDNGMVSLANFSNLAVGSGSTLSYSATVAGKAIMGEVGINGTASMSGFVPPPPPGVPEPGTIALLISGLVGLVLKKRLLV